METENVDAAWYRANERTLNATAPAVQSGNTWSKTLHHRWFLVTGRFASAVILVAVLPSSGLHPDEPSPAERLSTLLERRVLSPATAAQEFREFVERRIPELTLPPTAELWDEQQSKLRARVLEEVVFRGVPPEWRSGPPETVWLDEIKTPHGYSIRKLRFEALPGLWIPALLYQPDVLAASAPVVLNVNGHDRDGKAAVYKQIRCIHQARQGMLTLNLEWLGMGQLRSPDLSHGHLGKLDLCGQSGLSVFYLAMSRGLDVLLALPHADPDRVAVTGLSGGGWQTIVLSALDHRVTLAVPVAGYSALVQRLSHHGSIGDLEQIPSDLISIVDYTHLTAMMAPRPTLLIYNQNDNCCFPSGLVKPTTFDPVVPFFDRAGASTLFRWHNNRDPGTHNYELDNRKQLYAFLREHFSLDPETSDDELSSQDAVLTLEELTVPLPAENAQFHSLAARAARGLPRDTSEMSVATRLARLRAILRWEGLHVTDQAPADDGVRSPAVGDVSVRHWKLRLGESWTLPVVIVEPATVASTTVLLADEGWATEAERIGRLVKRGVRVIGVDALLVGQNRGAIGRHQSSMILASIGTRPLGIQVAQVAAAVHYFRRTLAVSGVDVVSVGPRMGLVALCLHALLGRTSVASITTEQMPETLHRFLEPSASYARTPEVYCFGLLEWFDVPQLRELAARSPIKTETTR